MAEKRDWLKISKQVLEVPTPYIKGSAASIAGKYDASQHFANARTRLLYGERDAAGIRQQGRETASDAKVAMVAQGGVVDSQMLAQIKKQSDLDAISALYDSKADAMTSRHQGEMARLKAKQEYRAGVLGLGSNLLMAGATYKWGGPPKAKTPKVEMA